MSDDRHDRHGDGARSNTGRLSRAGMLAVALIVACCAGYLPLLHQRYGDFRAFYCAGRAVLMHTDPYREHPLRDCEREIQAPGVSPGIEAAAVPAPFPGYVLAGLAVLARLPFGTAALVWLAASIGSVAWACMLLARTLRMSPVVTAVVIGFPAVSAALQLGQITPLVMLSLAGAVYLLERRKPGWAAIVAIPLAIEPHVAAAALVALFIAEPKSRPPLVSGGVLLATLSLATLGLAENREYLREVLPSHAGANLFDVQQYSVAHLAALAGFTPDAARAFGSWWYAIAAAAGVIFALRLRARYGPAAIILVPIACEVFGGVYVHMAQLAFAVPAFILLVPRGGPWRAPAVAALFVAAMPWNVIVNYPMFAPAVAALAIIWCGQWRLTGMGIPLAAAGACGLLGFFAWGVMALNGTSAVGPFHPLGNPLADVSWGLWQSALQARRSPMALAWSIAVQVPTFAAISAFIVALAALAIAPGRRRDVGTLGSPTVVNP